MNKKKIPEKNSMKNDQIFIKMFNTTSRDSIFQQMIFAKNCLQWSKIYKAGVYETSDNNITITKFAENMFALGMYQTAEAIYNKLVQHKTI